jgi:hypothetical protein
MDWLTSRDKVCSELLVGISERPQHRWEDACCTHVAWAPLTLRGPSGSCSFVLMNYINFSLRYSVMWRRVVCCISTEFCREHGGTMLLRNVGICLRNFMCCLNSGDAWFESRPRNDFPGRGFVGGPQPLQTNAPSSFRVPSHSFLAYRLMIILFGFGISGTRSRDSSVGVATRPEAGGPSVRGSIHCSVIRNVETGRGAHAASCTVGICGSVLGHKAAGARSCALNTI